MVSVVRVQRCITVAASAIARRPLPRVITMDIMAVHGGAEDVISGLDSLAAIPTDDGVT